MGGWLKNLMQPVNNLTAGIGSAIGSIGKGVGSGATSLGKGYEGMLGGLGKMVGSPMMLIALGIAGVAVIFVMK